MAGRPTVAENLMLAKARLRLAARAADGGPAASTSLARLLALAPGAGRGLLVGAAAFLLLRSPALRRVALSTVAGRLLGRLF